MFDAAERHASLDALSEALAEGAPVPDVVVVDAASADFDGAVAGGDAGLADDDAVAADHDADPIAAIHALTERTLALLQAWLASEPLAGARLLWVTRGAVAVDGREAPDLAQAAVVGLLRSAHSEHPDRLTVLDVDDSEPPLPALAAALADQESVVALRDGVLLVPRLAHFTADVPRVGGAPWRLSLGTAGTLDGIGFADASGCRAPAGSRRGPDRRARRGSELQGRRRVARSRLRGHHRARGLRGGAGDRGGGDRPRAG